MNDPPSLPPDYRPLEEPPSGARPDRVDTPDVRPTRPRAPRSPPKRRLSPVGVLVLVLVAPAGYLAYQLVAPSGDTAMLEGSLPPMVPLQLDRPGGGTGLTAAVGPELSGPAGSSVLLALRAMGAGGVPLADTAVRFRVLSGEGTLPSPTIRTDGEGLAAVPLELPALAGTTVVSAEIVGSALAPVRFEVTARTGLAERIEIIGGAGQEAPAGGLLPERMAVQVSDGAGSPVPGAEVHFQVASGGGIVGPTRLRTDSLGRASARWRLGFAAGTQRLMVVTPDVSGSVTFTATAQGGLAESSPADPPPERPSPTEAPPSAGTVSVVRTTFAVGGSHVCTVAAGRAACRGAGDRGQSAGTTSGTLAAVAAGTTHSCGLDPSGVASCWGANDSGQLGDESRTDRGTPVAVATDRRFFALAAGASHSCGLTGGGTAACWGQNLNGQLGDGSRDDRGAPRTVAGGGSFAGIAAGWNHTCALTGGGAVSCWGLNAQGQLGDGSRLDRLVPASVSGRFTSIAAGSAHTCGISASEVMCWGANRFGQLGDGTTEDRTAPVSVEGLQGTPVRIAAGAVHTCALVSDGSTYCWGQNLHGQLGDGSTQNRSTPTAVGGSLRFERIHAGGALTCGFTAAGAQYCWGLNQSGQLGDGTRANRALPTRVVG